MKTFSIIASALLSLAVAGAAAAQDGPPMTHVRGSVVSLSGTDLKVKSRDGRMVDVTVPTGAMVASVVRASLASIKPGDYVGIASMANAKGDKALEVLIFPPALKGVGEGNHGWDLKPNSSMTNASVSNLVKGVHGNTVSLSYNGGEQKQITIPASAPVVTLAPATTADLKPGAIVFIAATGSAGALTGRQIVVGKNGVVPPM